MAETRGVPWDCTYFKSDSAAEGMGWGVCGGNIEGEPPRRSSGLLRCMELLRGGVEKRETGVGSGVVAEGDMYEVS